MSKGTGSNGVRLATHHNRPSSPLCVDYPPRATNILLSLPVVGQNKTINVGAGCQSCIHAWPGRPRVDPWPDLGTGPQDSPAPSPGLGHRVGFRANKSSGEKESQFNTVKSWIMHEDELFFWTKVSIKTSWSPMVDVCWWSSTSTSTSTSTRRLRRPVPPSCEPDDAHVVVKVICDNVFILYRYGSESSIACYSLWSLLPFQFMEITFCIDL